MNKLRVGMMSSYNECCGIAAYLERMLLAMDPNQIDVTLLHNVPFKRVRGAMVPPCISSSQEVFKVTIWTNEVYFDEGAALAALSDVDVLHIQFESSLYYRQWMLPFIDKIRAMGIRVVVTVHSCLWPEMYSRAHRFISHSKELADQLGGAYLPMPVFVTVYRELQKYDRITSFGLGRNMDGMVNDALAKVHDTYPRLHFTPTYGHHQWRSNQALTDDLYTSQLITLLYPPIGTEVRSSSAALALGVGRPLVVTDTVWFRTVLDVFGRTGVWGVYAADNVDQLVNVIHDVMRLDDAEMRARFDMRIAAARQERMTLEQVVEDHMTLYRSLT